MPPGPVDRSPPAASSAPRAVGEPALPMPVVVEPGEPVEAYWRRRLTQHTGDWYAGLRLQKFPEDLRVYEHLLWACNPDAVIELGSHRGGSTLWFRDRLAALARYRPGSVRRVIAVSEDVGPAREGVALRDPTWRDSITFVEGDVLDPALPELVAAALPSSTSCLVVEDTDHHYDTTLGAVSDWLAGAGGVDFVQRRELELYGLTTSPYGWLQRRVP